MGGKSKGGENLAQALNPDPRLTNYSVRGMEQMENLLAGGQRRDTSQSNRSRAQAYGELGIDRRTQLSPEEERELGITYDGQGGSGGGSYDPLGGVPDTPEYYEGDLVADFNRQQESALDRQYQRGMDGSAQEQAFDSYLTDQLGQNYDPSAITEGAQQFAQSGQMGANALRALGQQGMGLGDAAAFAGGPQSAYDQALMSQASGTINPLTSAMFQQAAGDLSEQFNENVVPGINSQFRSAGRSGSGSQARALTDAAGELADAQAGLAANMFGSASESALGRQLAAAQGGLGNLLGERTLGADLYGRDRALQTQAAQAGAGFGLQGLGQMGDIYRTQVGQQQGAAGLAPMAQDMDFQNIQAMLASGNQRQDQSQREMSANIEREMYNRNLDIENFNRRMNALQGRTTQANPANFGSMSRSSGKNWGKSA